MTNLEQRNENKLDYHTAYIMKPYTDTNDKIDSRKCLYSEINANDKARKKAARRASKKLLNKELSFYLYQKKYGKQF